MANGAPPPRKSARKPSQASENGHVEEDATQVMEVLDRDPGAPEEAPQPPPNAVLVIRDDSEPGKIKVQLQTMGDVRLTEVEKLLKTALKEAEEQLG